MFTFWDWVGGRFSLWSKAGLAIPLTIGYENFEELLNGAFHADNHFIQSEPGKNIPVIMALLTTWYTNFFNCQTKAILPYCQDLHFLPAYLQQSVMESNGKMADRNGEQVDYSTGPIIWGEPGTNGQHAFFQLLHQGTQLVPSDFIGCAQSHYETGDHHQLLMSNFFAQTEALMKGKTEMEVQKELGEQGLTTEEIAAILPYKIFPGNKPSNCFLLKELSPRTLGQLVAYYEHMIFCSGVIWNIYSFDQWGVELGKQLAGNIFSQMKEKTSSSTANLLDIYQRMRENDN
jgi:glucose-6-phosphate isomerase